MDKELLEINVDAFPWESEVQKEGYLNLVQYWRKFGLHPVMPLTSPENLTALFFIQKDHESNEYWRDMVGEQFSGLQNEIHELQKTVAENRERTEALLTTIELLTEAVKAQGQLNQLLTANAGARDRTTP